MEENGTEEPDQCRKAIAKEKKENTPLEKTSRCQTTQQSEDMLPFCETLVDSYDDDDDAIAEMPT